MLASDLSNGPELSMREDMTENVTKQRSNNSTDLVRDAWRAVEIKQRQQPLPPPPELRAVRNKANSDYVIPQAGYENIITS
jgi:hypothetical protein